MLREEGSWKWHGKFLESPSGKGGGLLEILWKMPGKHLENWKAERDFFMVGKNSLKEGQ